MTARKEPQREPQGIEPTAQGARASAAAGDGEKPVFGEQILSELSAQNERDKNDESGSAQADAASPAAEPEGPGPHTVRVGREEEFRSPEGTSNARAYLPARTLTPGRNAPVDKVRVRVNDPRRVPTVRLPREQKIAPTPADGRARGPRAAGGPAAAEAAPAQRSSALLTTARTTRAVSRPWVRWVVVAAIAVAIALLAAWIRSARAEPLPGALSSVCHPSLPR